MQFRDEDGVVTASEARRRSSIGKDDSTQRWLVRRIFEEIKHRSYFGHNFYLLNNPHDCKTFEKFPILKKTLEALGYEVEEISPAPCVYAIKW